MSLGDSEGKDLDCFHSSAFPELWAAMLNSRTANINRPILRPTCILLHHKTINKVYLASNYPVNDKAGPGFEGKF